MKRTSGRQAVNDDEWYTPYDTAKKVADFLFQHLDKDQPILCPADILPDESESTIPTALRDAGFTNVRVTGNLPVEDNGAWMEGEVIVTNPPFSMLVPFRNFVRENGVKYCVLSRSGAMRLSWSIPDLGQNFISTDGRSVAASWQQNIANTIVPDTEDKSIGNCLNCERVACPKNDMTGSLKPRQERKLYGYSTAVKLGISGHWCKVYTANGKMAFSRFFYPEE